MTEMTLLEAVAQVGFPIAVAIFLLWKGYTQDKEYLKALQDLSAALREHMRQKDEALQMLREQHNAITAAYLEGKRYPQNP
jgi:uncharacterized membrane protein YccC